MLAAWTADTAAAKWQQEEGDFILPACFLLLLFSLDCSQLTPGTVKPLLGHFSPKRWMLSLLLAVEIF